MKNTRYLIWPMILILCFLVAGCAEGCSLIGPLMEDACALNPDSAHCYQGSGVQSSNPATCEKIKAPEEFAKVGSNPPRDKCYLMIAQNTGIYSICNNIKGGMYSYTKEECVTGIATNKIDPQGCTKLSGEEATRCKSDVGALVTKDKLKSMDDEIDAAKHDLGSSGDPDLTRKLKDLETKRNQLVGVMTDANKQGYFKDKREEITGDVEDDDVKSDIAKTFSQFRASNPNANMDQLLTKLKDIKDQKQFVKNLDEQANELVDTIKTSASDYVDEKKGEMVDNLKDKGWSWFKENGGDRLKYGMDKLETLKGKYDKASAEYDKISKQIAKIKSVYDEVSGVYKKVDDLNKQVASGQIKAEHAKVLKGAVMLGKGLEYATKYVPVFGSTISKVSTATFETTLKLANERAKRSNSLEKCFDHPETCDTEGITAY